ncbi:MAG: Rrf2 family transcriptional regulator [Pseudomonadota bacterium]
MQLTRFTDYSLRVLIHLGNHPDGLATVSELAALHDVSRHHLTRVVYQLGLRGYIETVRGKGGGFRLARPPEAIRIGDVVRDMEQSFDLAECFRTDGSRCVLLPGCGLKGMLAEAGRVFLESLDRHTLADLVAPASGKQSAVSGKAARRRK